MAGAGIKSKGLQKGNERPEEVSNRAFLPVFDIFGTFMQ
jgi:hypothetical protein